MKQQIIMSREEFINKFKKDMAETNKMITPDTELNVLIMSSNNKIIKFAEVVVEINIPDNKEE